MALGEVLSPKGRYVVGKFAPASLPPGPPAGKLPPTGQDATLSRRDVSRRFLTLVTAGQAEQGGEGAAWEPTN